MGQSHAVLSRCLLLTTSHKQKRKKECNDTNRADLSEMDDVGGQSSSNKAMRGVWVVQKPDLQRNQAFAAQVDGLNLLLLLPVPYMQITAIAGGYKQWIETLQHHRYHKLSRSFCSCEPFLQYIANIHMYTDDHNIYTCICTFKNIIKKTCIALHEIK